ncbi:hypothetical protein LTR22_023420 [Elasticomyces elasticus]|nr:hypothetical protein LTR22_023420 [Elasticomyces elasticus]KAK4904722.1 hypothetical protein LTR49_025893 [Elasticomyces elasticus]KAK5746530.1 hypothetical protein LTS12_022713 [Elasticomyces elasticus]
MFCRIDAVLAKSDAGMTARLDTQTTAVMLEVLKLPELRLDIFSLLPARGFVEGAAGNRPYMGIQPRNDGQRSTVSMTKSPAMSDGGGVYLDKLASTPKEEAQIKEAYAIDLEKRGEQIIFNPFFTSLWPQHPTNMTSCPYVRTSQSPKTASWRRMQLTSPPMLQVDISLWYTKSNGKGSQLVPSTGKTPSGVTLGHVADLLAAKTKKLNVHWIQVIGHEYWLRSADAIVVPPNANVGNEESRPGVYVNHSNGIVFPGFI